MEQFFRVPNKVFNLPLSNNELLVLIYLIRCSNNSDAFPSYENIAESCKISRMTAYRCVKNMNGRYITITKKYGVVNHYRVLDPYHHDTPPVPP